jgi:hypothetical protein
MSSGWQYIISFRNFQWENELQQIQLYGLFSNLNLSKMARLYSDPMKDPRLTNGGTSSNGFSDYLTKVATLIPGEIIAGYLMLLGQNG